MILLVLYLTGLASYEPMLSWTAHTTYTHTHTHTHTHTRQLKVLWIFGANLQRSESHSYLV